MNPFHTEQSRAEGKRRSRNEEISLNGINDIAEKAGRQSRVFSEREEIRIHSFMKPILREPERRRASEGGGGRYRGKGQKRRTNRGIKRG